MTVLKTIEEAGDLFGDAIAGDDTARGRVKALVKGNAYISESVSSSDLARAFVIGTRQQLQAQYEELKPTWTDFASRLKFPDFKPQFLRELTFDDDTNLPTNGGTKTKPGSLPRIPEGTEYPKFGFTTSANGVLLAKNGASFGFTWEMVINDEWQLIQSIPGELLRFASNTEDTEAYGILADDLGPNALVFSAGNGNTNTGASLFDKEYALDLNALSLAKKAIRNRRVNGRRVTVPKFRLVVPTTMRDQAEALLAVKEYVARNADNTKEIKVTPTNGDVALTTTDWLDQIDESASASKTWYLVPDKGFDGKRKSIAVAFLEGNEAPDVRISGGGGNYVGGGAVPGLEGSLLNDTGEYRVRHVVSGAFLNGQSLLASRGTEATAAPEQFFMP